jgi:hypothetical protein
MATEDLDEMVARTVRQSSQIAAGRWGKDYLEDANYVYQPETLQYNDLITGRECVVLARTPDEELKYSKEFNTQAWSCDGSTLGFWEINYSTGLRRTNNPGVSATRDYIRWLVRSDGSYLKAAEGLIQSAQDFGGFGWANTENSFYGFGDSSGQKELLYKGTISETNVVTGASTSLLNTKTADDAYSIVTQHKAYQKRGISNDDNWMTVYSGTAQNYGTTINCPGIMLIALNAGIGPTISKYWGINRQVYEYGDHLRSAEGNSHDRFPFGRNNEYIVIEYSNEHVWYLEKMSGSASDEGPLWENWDGDSYGANDIIPISNGYNRPPQPEGVHTYYYNHPVMDRWQRFVLTGEGDPIPGTRIYELLTGDGFDGDEGQILTGISTRDQYDGDHHAWDGWTDTVLCFPPYVGTAPSASITMYARKINFTSGTAGTLGLAYPVYSTHFVYSDYVRDRNYSAYPRPSQSPDGTKAAVSDYFLNTTSSYPYLKYAVVYYPHPPKQFAAAAATGTVTLNWTWDADSKYTTRGYPTEGVSDPPEPREIKYTHVWRSDNGTTGWTELTSTGVPFISRSYNVDQQGGTTKYYALTSEEHSRLESRVLSNVIRVILDGSGNLTSSTQTAAYPADPGCMDLANIQDFWTTAPAKPTAFTVTAQATPGHNLLAWTGSTSAKARYYNIYYSSDGTFPTCDQQHRIASVPIGTSSWLDWNAHLTNPANYAITTVDRYGNESGPAGDDTENPVITITLPSATGTYTIDAASVTVSGSGTDDTAVTSVTWINSLGGYGTASGTDSWSFTCPLQYGANIVTVTGHDGYSHTGTATITITRNPPALAGSMSRAHMRLR